VREAHENAVFDPRILQGEELPPVIILVVGDVEDRGASLGDLPKGDHSAIRRLVERPIAHTVIPANRPTRSGSLNNSFADENRSSGRFAIIFKTHPWNRSGIAIWYFFGFSGPAVR
jgi:hypothetical protein